MIGEKISPSEEQIVAINNQYLVKTTDLLHSSSRLEIFRADDLQWDQKFFLTTTLEIFS